MGLILLVFSWMSLVLTAYWWVPVVVTLCQGCVWSHSQAHGTSWGVKGVVWLLNHWWWLVLGMASGSCLFLPLPRMDKQQPRPWQAGGTLPTLKGSQREMFNWAA